MSENGNKMSYPFVIFIFPILKVFIKPNGSLTFHKYPLSLKAFFKLYSEYCYKNIGGQSSTMSLDIS